MWLLCEKLKAAQNNCRKGNDVIAIRGRQHRRDQPRVAWDCAARSLLVPLLLAGTMLFAPQAQAFEFFGYKFFESEEEKADAEIADPLRYSATLTVPDGDSELSGRLETASALVSDQERPVSGSLGLIAKARGDRDRLVAALYENARYDGVVTVAIGGRDIDTLEPDAVFAGPQPIPVTITIQAGRVFTFGDVSLKGDAAGLTPEEFDLARGGDASSTQIIKAEAQIVRRLKEEGRPLATVTSRDVVADHDTGTLDVALTVAAGPVAGYGDTSVAGTDEVDADFTAYMAGLPKGKTYSPQDLDDARERLQGLQVFSSVTVKEAQALDAQGNIPVSVEVSERKKRYYGVGATISNTEGLGLEGYWGHRNLFGRAEKLRIEGAISGIGGNGVKEGESADALNYVKNLNYNAGIMFEKPGVIGPASRFFWNTRVLLEHPDAYDRFSARSSLGVAYDLTRRQSVSAELAIEYAKITDAFEPERKFLIVSTPLQYVFDARDSKLDPKSGFRLLAFAEPSYDALSRVPFVKFKGEGSAYYSLDTDGKFVLAGRTVVGSILGANLAEIPADRRFYSGGGGSVRGYAYQGIGPRNVAGQPTGGLSLVEGSVELRFAVTEKFGIVPFIDAGTVSSKSFPDFSDFRAGAGVGIRYLTPFGPLRVDGAIPLNPGPGDPDFGIYAGIGQAF
jgi:translocation and assembly module TamA